MIRQFSYLFMYICFMIACGYMNVDPIYALVLLSTSHIVGEINK